MRKFSIKLLKFFIGIWCVAFLIFFISIFLKHRGIIVPIFECYRQSFENYSDLLSSNWFFNLCFGIGFIIVFIYLFIRSNKDMGWDDLSKKYCLSRKEIEHLNLNYDYGQSYLNGIYYSGIHVSSIQKGLILRHPFPFNYLKPSLLIPWHEIQSIVVERGLKPEGKNNIFKKIKGKISPWKYADVKLLDKNIKIIIPWKSNVKENAPKNIIVAF